MKKLLTASLVAIMAVTAANADIASTGYVNKYTGADEQGQMTLTGDVLDGATTLAGAVNAIASAVDGLTKGGDGTSVSEQIDTAVGDLGKNAQGQDYTNVAAAIAGEVGKLENGQVKTNADNIAKLDGAVTEAGSVKYQINELSTTVDGKLSLKQDKSNIVSSLDAKANQTSEEKYPSVAAAYAIVDDAIGSLTGGDITEIKSMVGAATSAAYKEITGDPNVVASVTALQDDKADWGTSLADYKIADAYTKTETDGKITTAVEALDANPENVGTNDGSYVTAVAQADGKITVSTVAFDTALNAESTNAVQNKVVQAELAKKANDSELSAVAKLALPVECADGAATCALVYDPTAPNKLKWESIMN